MINPVEYYISELLFLHDCVIIPKFGGFVGNPKSASINSTTGVISPPSKQILFNVNLKTNDGLLISHIANKESISQQKAQQEVEKFAQKCNSKLSKSSILRIKDIGLFTLGKEKNIIFLQDSSKNYSVDAFGLKATHKKLITREKSTEKEFKSTVKNISEINFNVADLFRVAAVMIPLALISYLSISQQDKINSIYAQMATFSPFTLNSNTEIEDDIIQKNDIEYSSSDKNLSEIIVEEEIAIDDEVSIFIPSNTYYIIAGAFAEKENAYKLLNELRTSNINAEILDGSNLLRVSYDYFYNREDAILALNEVKRDIPKAWLLTK